jgi:hypothetical protein
MLSLREHLLNCLLNGVLFTLVAGFLMWSAR